MAKYKKTIKDVNKELVLKTIRHNAPITIDSIVNLAGLSRPTTVNIIDYLTESNIVETVGFAETECGRSPALLDLSSKKYFAVGMDIEFPGIRITLVNLKRQCICEHSWNIEASLNPDMIITKLIEELSNLMMHYNCAKENCVGIGIGISGLIDSKKGISLFNERACGWSNINLKDKFYETFKTPVIISNDVHLLAMTEIDLNSNVKDKNFIYLAIRSGVGSAIVSKGQLFTGSFGNAGFLGHIVIDKNGERCKCGQCGCLELFLSKPAILQKYLNLNDAISSQEKNEISLKTIVENYKANDPIAKTVINEMAQYLALGISNMIKLVDYYHIVIGCIDEVANFEFIDLVRESMKSNIYPPLFEKITLELGKAENDQCALGGALLMIDKFFNNYFH